MNINEITEQANKLIDEAGLINLSRKELCERCEIPTGSFDYWAGCSFTEFISTLKDCGKTHKVSKKRVFANIRKDQILTAAIDLSKTKGYNRVTRDELAEAAGVSKGLINHYFHTMNQLRGAIVKRAIKNNVEEIIQQAVECKDKRVA